MIPKVSGVYAIINSVNAHHYIGSSVNVRMRWQTHLSKLRKGKNESLILQNAWNKYGEDAFTFVVLEEVADHTQLIAVEQKYMDERLPEYNARIIAQSRLGMKNNPESVAKMRASLTGLKRTDEQKINYGNGRRGARQSPESIERIRRGATNPSAETRQKMSDAKKGIAPTKAIEASASAARGKHRPQEVIDKISRTKKEANRLRREQGIPLGLGRDETGRFIPKQS